METSDTFTLRQPSRHVSRPTRMATWILLALVFLLPLIAIPNPAASFFFTKTALAALGALVALVFFALGALREGELRITTSRIIFAAWLIPLAVLIAAFFSPAPMLSFFGYELSLDSVAFAATLALVATLSAVLFSRRGTATGAYAALGVAGWILAVFEAVRLFSHGSLLSLSIFANVLGNLAGSWNDLAIFFGLLCVLSLITLVSTSVSGMRRTFVSITAFVSLCFVAVVNFTPVWGLIALAALGSFAFGFMRRTENARRHVSLTSLIALAAAVFFLFGGSGVAASITDYFGTAQLEARPSLQSTLEVARGVYGAHAVLGSGPNLFLLAWDAYHPADINTTLFWNTDFSSGIGIVPTAFVTGGLVVGAAWVLFLVMFLIVGIRALLLARFADEHAYYLSVSSFLAAAYLLALTVIYIPGPALMALAFIFVGIFVASIRDRGAGHETAIPVGRESRVGFAAALILIVLMLASLAGIGFIGSAYASSVHFGNATLAATRGDIDTTINEAGAANRIMPQDRATRLIASAQTARISNLISSTAEPTQAQQDEFRQSLASAIENALAATKYDSADYRNWLVLAGVYHAVVPLKIQGAYENAVKAYAEAEKRAPTNPLISLNEAQLEIANGNLDAARKPLEEAITRKSDYTPAIFLYSQLEATAGNLPEALKRAEAATVFEPDNAILLFQLGALRFASGDYQGAKAPLAHAVEVSPSYSNARFFFGQTLYKLGDQQGAFAQFQAVGALNPDNAQVKQILDQLSAGKDPFATSTPKGKPSGTRTTQ